MPSTRSRAGAVHALGLEAPPSAIDTLFETFERDEGGGLRYKELCRELRREVEPFETNPVVRDARSMPDAAGGFLTGLASLCGALKPTAAAPRQNGAHTEAVVPAAAAAVTPAPAPAAAPPIDATPKGQGKVPPRGKAAQAQASAPRAVDLEALAAHEVAISELVDLVETAAPWAAWQAAESVSDLPAHSVSRRGRSSQRLPPARSLLADALSVVALLMVLRSAYVQLAISFPPTPPLALGTAAATPIHRPSPTDHRLHRPTLRHPQRPYPSAGQRTVPPTVPPTASSTAHDSDDDDASNRGLPEWVASLLGLAPLHAFAMMAWLVLLCTLLRQLWARLAPPRPPPTVEAAEAASMTPLLPLTAPGGGSATHWAARMPVAAPFAHWATLALAELFCAAYAACWASPLQPFAPPPSALVAAAAGASPASASLAAAEALLLARSLGSAHTLAAGGAGLLLAAACWRVLLIQLWGCRCLSAAAALPSAEAAVAPPAALAPKPAAKVAPAAAMPPAAAPPPPPPSRRAGPGCCQRMIETLKRLVAAKSAAPPAAASDRRGASVGAAPGGGAGKNRRALPARGRSATPPPRAGAKSKGTNGRRQLM